MDSASLTLADENSEVFHWDRVSAHSADCAFCLFVRSCHESLSCVNGRGRSWR